MAYPAELCTLDASESVELEGELSRLADVIDYCHTQMEQHLSGNLCS